MVRVERSGQGWALVGDEDDVRLAGEFVEELLAAGRSSYTQRSYAMGLALFLRWLQEQGRPLGEVTRSTIVHYSRSLAESTPPPSALTVNHRLSVLSSFFVWLIAREDGIERGAWWQGNPVPGPSERLVHRAMGRDVPRRERAELRRRVPTRVPRGSGAAAAAQLVAGAPSLRDKAILTLLWRTGARIGDWLSESDRHGVLGLALDDIDARNRMVRVRLKGARDEHRVPVTDDFWELWQPYLAAEQGGASGPWAWVGQRRGRGRPLRYDAFAAMLRGLGERAGVRVHAHMFRHELAQAVVNAAGLQVAQEILGHRHLGTTAAYYARVDETAMVAGVEAAARRGIESLAATAAWVFPYDEITLAELGRLTGDRVEDEA
jgi:site-specific recombinase XerD